MADDAHMLAYSAILTWLMIMGAAYIRTGGSFPLMFSNRDALPPETALAGRADRAVKNMLENMVLFIAAWAAAKGAGAGGWKVTRGAQLFFAARLLYWPVYLAGVRVVRTGLWSAGVVGIGLLVYAAVSA
jgi:uncharacterized MAPEG superfamily protein